MNSTAMNLDEFKLSQVKRLAALPCFTGLMRNSGRSGQGRMRSLRAVRRALVKEFPEMQSEETNAVLSEIRQRAMNAL